MTVSGIRTGIENPHSTETGGEPSARPTDSTVPGVDSDARNAHVGGSLAVDAATFRDLKTELTRFMLSYKFATDEMMTKVNILKEEFSSIHDYSPIEHVNSRLKTPEGILQKAVRKGCPLALDDIRAQIQDIAGIRITCSFISDTYRVLELLMSQVDVTVLEVKDYISQPKRNGYRSLHLIVAIPVFMSDRVEPVTVEIQIRTVAMDFWASLEHKIYYKYQGRVPADLVHDLKQAADVANRLDAQMERLHNQVVALGPENPADTDIAVLAGLSQFAVPAELLAAFGTEPRNHDTRNGATPAANDQNANDRHETGPDRKRA